jgi:hypothetical protein
MSFDGSQSLCGSYVYALLLNSPVRITRVESSGPLRQHSILMSEECATTIYVLVHDILIKALESFDTAGRHNARATPRELARVVGEAHPGHAPSS